MKFAELKTSSVKNKKRVGRGIAAGQGKTAGRGTKGQKSRTGYSKRPGFEGGQNPLMQRLPKLRGFKTKKVKPEVVYTGQLDQISGASVDAKALAEAGLVSSAFCTIKIISKGEVTKKHVVKVALASSSAIESIEKAGGSFEPTERLARPATAKKTDAKAKAAKK